MVHMTDPIVSFFLISLKANCSQHANCAFCLWSVLQVLFKPWWGNIRSMTVPCTDIESGQDVSYSDTADQPCVTKQAPCAKGHLTIFPAGNHSKACCSFKLYFPCLWAVLLIQHLQTTSSLSQVVPSFPSHVLDPSLKFRASSKVYHENNKPKN